MQVLVDHSTNVTTTGKITRYDVSPFATSSTQGVPSANGDLRVTVQASRQLTIEAEVISGRGESNHVVWQQNLQYSNLQLYLQNSTTQARRCLPNAPFDGVIIDNLTFRSSSKPAVAPRVRHTMVGR